MKLGFEYTGDFKDGKMTGEGEILYSNFSKYRGGVQNGMKHGEGRIDYPNGNYYKGGWKLNKKSGYGITEWKNRGELYEGEWEDNNLNGYGTYLWFEQNRKINILVNRYQGEFKNGKRNGKGCFYYADGSVYIGEWFENSKDGFAILIQDDGNIEVKIYYRNRPFKKLIPILEDCIFRHFTIPRTEEEKVEEASLKIENDVEQSVASRGQRSVRHQLRGGTRTRIRTENNSQITTTTHRNFSVRENRQNAFGSTNRNPSQNNLTQLNSANNLSLTNNNNNVVEEEEEKTVVEAINQPSQRNLERTANRSFSVMMESELGTNPYYKLIDFSDIFELVEITKRRKVRKEFLIVLLRNHSEINFIYKHYKKKFLEFSDREGHCMRFKGFWKFLEEIRFQNCNFWMPTLHQFYTHGRKNGYCLTEKKEIVELRLEYLKKIYKEEILKMSDDEIYNIVSGDNNPSKTPNFRMKNDKESENIEKKKMVKNVQGYPPKYFEKHEKRFLELMKKKKEPKEPSGDDQKNDPFLALDSDLDRLMAGGSHISMMDITNPSIYLTKNFTNEDFPNVRKFKFNKEIA